MLETLLIALPLVALLVGTLCGYKIGHYGTMAKVHGSMAESLRLLSRRNETADFFRGCRVLAEEFTEGLRR